MRLYNSLTRKIEEFTPLNPPKITLYTCGPTVYDYPHIGHGRKYVMDDILKRILKSAGYDVEHVQNITDVGHLVSDADEGEDKLEKGAKREKKTVWDIAKYFEEEFNKDMKLLAIIPPDIQPRATGHIAEQISIINKLFEKGYAYDTPEAVYFDITKFRNYENLFGQSIAEKAVAFREDVKTGEQKKHPADFSLWFKRVGRFKDHTMHWDSPWGDGFPGWHIECSAMSMKYLGETIDIHTGGIDHLSIHHPNEIAQSEGATGKQFVRFWMHHAFLMVDGKKMSKSLGNYYRLNEVIEKGFDPMDLRYLYLLTHYRKALNFTWEGLTAAREARLKIVAQLAHYRSGKNESSKRTTLSPEKQEQIDRLRTEFEKALRDDLNTPQAIAVLWGTIKSNVPSEDKYDLLASFDEILGLRLNEQGAMSNEQKIPEDIQVLVTRREQLRNEKKWEEADTIRKQLFARGYEVEDMEEETVVRIKPINRLTD